MNHETSQSKLTSLPAGSKVVLGFSGGLDTSFCVKYLTEEKGYEIHSITVNTGGFSKDELREIEHHAHRLGVKTHTSVDAIGNLLQRDYRIPDLWKCSKK